MGLDSVVWYGVYGYCAMELRAVNSVSLTIGQVARGAGVGVETVRFYEREGLIATPPRRASGYRQYPPQVVQRILFIRRAKELGFSLREITELLSLRVDPSCTCGDVRRRAEDKVADIDERMRTLQRMREALVRLVDACHGSGPTSECPILDALEEADAGGAARVEAGCEMSSRLSRADVGTGGAPARGARGREGGAR